MALWRMGSKTAGRTIIRTARIFTYSRGFWKNS